MSKIIEGDILKLKKGVIVHQCNCRGSMGAGIAKSIAQKWPEVKKPYEVLCRTVKSNKLLGTIQIMPIELNELYIVNLFGQDGYGKKGNYTQYSAHSTAWHQIDEYFRDKKIDIYAPFMIGAALAGGDWKLIHNIAEKNVPDIIWVRYKKGISFEF